MDFAKERVFLMKPIMRSSTTSKPIKLNGVESSSIIRFGRELGIRLIRRRTGYVGTRAGPVLGGKCVLAWSPSTWKYLCGKWIRCFTSFLWASVRHLLILFTSNFSIDFSVINHIMWNPDLKGSFQNDFFPRFFTYTSCISNKRSFFKPPSSHKTIIIDVQVRDKR